MRLAYDFDGTQLWHGDCLSVLHALPAESVHCAICSPPYFHLRSYLDNGHADKASEIGTEDSPDAYVAKLVEVFRAVWRVLRADATLWVVIGDSYNGSGGAGGDYNAGGLKEGQPKYKGSRVNNLGPKQLLMIPARVALALQADSWVLRQELVWAKGISFCPDYAGSVMPESVQDRCTKSHEMVYMFAKQPSYFYDQMAVREANSPNSGKWGKSVITKTAEAQGNGRHGATSFMSREMSNEEVTEKYYRGGRNLRSVWAINPANFPEAHYATFPEALVSPIILAGTSAYGVCSACGNPYERVVEQDGIAYQDKGNRKRADAPGAETSPTSVFHTGTIAASHTTGWAATCTCGAPVVPACVLDPFCGSGTTAIVARRLGRRFVGIELNADYVAMSIRRIEREQPPLLVVT